MKLIQNIKAISRLALILLLLISFVIGAFLSYLWVMGGVIELGITIPDKPTVAITDMSFTPQNTSFFNITLLNPSYSPSEAKITKITTSTEKGKVYNITTANPSLPYEILAGYSQTFQCFWNWANYTGQTIRISASMVDGSGPTSEALTPFVSLQITDVHFNSSISITSFNLTIQGNEDSVIPVNITYIKVQTIVLEKEDVIPSLPYTLNPNSSVTLECVWDWTDYQNTTITIIAYSSQGYVSYATPVTPEPVVLEVTDVLFNESDINHFNVTIRNSENSSGYLDISKIILFLENDTFVEINKTEMDPSLPYRLHPNSSRTFECLWNWNIYRNKDVTFGVYTLQNYTTYYTAITPSPMEIENIIFDPTNTSSFSITVRNPEFYTTHVNLTEITLVLENGIIQSINGTEITPQFPYILEPNSTETFICPWNWIDYQDKNVAVMILSMENYTAQFTAVTPKRVFFAIVSVVFDPIDTNNFNITVRNSELSLDDVTITGIEVTSENGTVKVVPGAYPIFPYALSLDSTVTFQCIWNWTNYKNMNVVITVYTERGFTTSTKYTIPSSFW